MSKVSKIQAIWIITIKTIKARKENQSSVFRVANVILPRNTWPIVSPKDVKYT